jgi:hypothetical protein
MKSSKGKNAFLMTELAISVAILAIVFTAVCQLFYSANDEHRSTRQKIVMRYEADHQMDLLRLKAANGDALPIQDFDVEPGLRAAQGIEGLRCSVSVKEVEAGTSSIDHQPSTINRSLRHVSVVVEHDGKSGKPFKLESLIRVRRPK